MSFGAIAVGAGVVGAGVSAGVNAYGAHEAGKAAEGAQYALTHRLNKASGEVEQYANEYVSQLEMLDQNFDPYDMEQAFNSLYEAVIQPMERDFDENVLPGIQAAYSGGVMGASAGLSGASQEAESNARRGLSEKKADLRFQERGQAIARNYGEFDRRANLAGTTFNAKTAAPLLRANQAPMIYQAQQNTIAAQLAATQSLAKIPSQVLTGAVSGSNSLMSLKDTFKS